MKFVYSILMLIVLCDLAAQPIIGGQPADEGEYPWMASLVISDPSTGSSFPLCGASLIDPYWVVTAAHCVQFIPSSESSLRIVINSWTTDLATLPPEAEVFEVEEIFIHEAYDLTGFSFGNDLALIRLKEPAITQPIELATYSDSLFYQHYLPAKVLGWGLTDSMSFVFPDSLLVADPVFIDIDTCAQLYARSRFASLVSVNTERLICSGYYEGMTPMGAASGDSGGPLFYEDSGNYKLVGVVSGGDRLITTQQFPGVFVFIPHFLEWIYETMASYEEPSSVYSDYREILKCYISEDKHVLISGIDLSDNYSFVIYDLSGRAWINHEQSKGNSETSISIANLEPGMHFLVVQNISEGTHFNYKLLVH